jgi:phospholipid transport system substrate-binding protein
MAIRPLVLAALALLGACGPAWAGPPTARLEGLFAQANRILADPATAERPFDRLRETLTLVEDAFDFAGAAELALGREWHVRSAAERREFVELFADLLERAFVFGLAGRVDPGGVRVRFLRESREGPEATVETALATRDGGEIRLDYRMVERDSRWLVRDVVVDGVSVVANYRSQFQRIVAASSYAELVRQIRSRLGEGFITSRLAAGPPRQRVARVEEAPPPAAAPAPRVVAVAAPAAPANGPAAARGAPVPAYWVQVGAFRSLEAARRLAGLLGARNVMLTPRGPGAQGLVHVRVGPFAERREAVAELHALRSRGYQPFVVERRG